MIYVYEDYIHNKGILLRRLVTDCGGESVRLIDAGDIVDGILQDTPPRLFIMPGGADLYFCEKLDGDGNRRIRAYIEDGGIYLGICAGAYYGASYIEFAGDNPAWRIAGPRELDLIDCTARGPVKHFIEDGDITRGWHAAVTMTPSDESIQSPFLSYYEGGPVFELHDSQARILARYSDLADQPPAIIQKRTGAGTAILCAIHPEMQAANYGRTSYNHRNPNPERDRDIATKLAPYASEQLQLWHKLLNA